MIWLNFRRWNTIAGKIFVASRIYIKRYWTPLIILSLRRSYPRIDGNTMTVAMVAGEPLGSNDIVKIVDGVAYRVDNPSGESIWKMG